MANVITVHIAVDVGSDTVKIVYAYKDGDTDCTGKIVADPFSMAAIPSVAYFDTEDDSWMYANDVDKVDGKSLLTVVKITDLLHLLDDAEDEDIHADNVQYYKNNTLFPKYYFPQREVLTDDFEDSVSNDYAFNGKITPQKVCENFFSSLYLTVTTRLDKLFKKEGKQYKIVPTLVYPTFANAEYIAELKRLIKVSFGVEPDRVLSMAKSLCAYAQYSDRMERNDKAVIFNIGEEVISSVKVVFKDGGMTVDGLDGHNPPEELGGKDIDKAVADFIEMQISGRTSMGGEVREDALSSKQYLFMKDIKSAKVVLGMDIYDTPAFSEGVPISAARDVLIQRTITREQFASCIGLDSEHGIAKKFVDYMERELSLDINSDVKKVFITGGPVETYGLVPYIREHLKKRNIETYTFEKDDSEYEGVKNDGYNIMSHEDAVYAPALGMAIASLNKIGVDMVLALSYGVRLFRGRSGGQSIPFFKVLVNKGTHIPAGGASFFIPNPGDAHGITTGEETDKSASLPIVSTFFSEDDIAHSRKAPAITYISSNGENLMVFDTENAAMVEKLQTEAGLQFLNGNSGDADSTCATYYFDNRRVYIAEDVYLTIGVDIDAEGRATAYARNDAARNGNAETAIRYLDGKAPSGKELRQGGQKKSNQPQYNIPGGSSYNVPGGYNVPGSYNVPGEHYDATVYCKDIELRFKIKTQLT